LFAQPAPTATPIEHVIVIFDENNSFDHYFGTYPNAANPPGELPFTPLPRIRTYAGLRDAADLKSLERFGQRFAAGHQRAVRDAGAGSLFGLLRIWDAASISGDLAVR